MRKFHAHILNNLRDVLGGEENIGEERCTTSTTNSIQEIFLIMNIMPAIHLCAARKLKIIKANLKRVPFIKHGKKNCI